MSGAPGTEVGIAASDEFFCGGSFTLYVMKTKPTSQMTLMRLINEKLQNDNYDRSCSKGFHYLTHVEAN